MDYEKAYKAVLKTATQWIKDGCTDKERICLESVFPELRESEDERIRKEIIEFIQWSEDRGMTRHDFHQAKRPSEWIAYLEKQKEPIDPFDTKLFQDGVKEGRRLEREDMEKEQKPLSTEETELNSIAFLEQMGYTCIPPGAKQAEWSEDKFPKDIEKDATQFCFDKGFNITPYQAKEIATHYLMVGHNFGYVEGRKNAHIPAKELGLPSSMDFKQEWSEEDEKIRRNLMSLLANMRGDRITEETYQKYYPWLKDLRPSWKPSEEHFQGLRRAITKAEKGSDAWNSLTDLYEQLKKL